MAFDFDQTAAIALHSTGFADAAAGQLERPVAACPGWSVEDLVRHVIEVHWFWTTIVEERLDEPAADDRRPPPVATEQVIEAFKAGAERAVKVFSTADQSARVWTWAPAQQDVAFVTRHQVQEIAVHHWDAASAAGTTMSIAPVVAADSVDEFLHFSLSTDADPAEPARPPLDGSFVLRCNDFDAAWVVTDGDILGTVAVWAAPPESSELPTLSAPASDLLLWLYGRVAIHTSEVDLALLERFRALSFTD